MKQKKQLNLLIEFGGNISNASFFIIKRDQLIHALVEKSGYTKALKLVKYFTLHFYFDRYYTTRP
jgi:hypothetical protein